jgi:DUF1365 family protein
MSSSALYVGSVRHRRLGGPTHRFTYPVWYALIDLDDLPGLAERTRFFSHNRFNLTGFDDRDHMGPELQPVRSKLERWLRSRGVKEPSPSVGLLTHLKVLGHVFNPVSFFFCGDGEGSLHHVVAEVNNTFGETYCYLLEGGGNVVRHEEDKAFHVSPFQPVEGRYRFRITPPGPRFTAHIDVLRDGERAFDSTLSLERRQLSSTELVKTVLRHPHTGLRTLALIHYQALRLWLKRAPFHPKPAPPEGAWRTRYGELNRS